MISRKDFVDFRATKTTSQQTVGRHERRLYKTGCFKRKIMGFYLLFSSVLPKASNFPYPQNDFPINL